MYMIVFERIPCVTLESTEVHLGSVLEGCSSLLLPVYIRVSVKENVNVRLRSVSWKFQQFL